MLSRVGAVRDHGRMRDGEDQRSGGTPPVPADSQGADSDLDTPNCSDCLTRMAPAETASGEPYWTCTECGLVSLV
jgi:hypothetical protein